MKNINSVSSNIRDNLLKLNIGKYNQKNELMIYPIGTFYNIYDSINIKKESITPNGLLDYINNTTTFTKKGEFEESIYIPSLEIRDKVSIDLGYDSTQLKQYSYLEGNTYHEPKDKNWISMGVETALGYVLGDNIGISSTGEGVQVTSTSLDSSTSLIGRLTEYALGNESKIGKIGLVSLGTSLANSVIQRTRISEGVLEFFNKPIGFYDAVDTLDFDKMGNSSIPEGISKFSKNMLPIYFYTEIKKADVKEYSWLNEGQISINGSKITSDKDSLINENGILMPVDSSTFSTQSLLYKTQKLFSNGKIQTLISKLGTDTINGDSNVNSSNPASKGRPLTTKTGNYFRGWSASSGYNKISSLLRPFDDDSKTNLKKNLARVRPNADSSGSLETYGVLQDDGFVKIAPYSDDKFGKPDLKKYMFSIENLAWKDSIDSLIEGTSQEGPNGGRIMWFPPYDINFNETTSINWNADTFIGRGEPVYTYTNTERNGTLSFKIIVDHPSIINYYKQSKEITEGMDDDYLRFFAGRDVIKLSDEFNKPDANEPTAIKTAPVNKPVTYSFKVFFPNNYSGIYDGYEDALKYLYQGHAESITGTITNTNGYENEVGDWMGLSDNTLTPTYEDEYWYRVDTLQNLTDIQKKDAISYGLNNLISPDGTNGYSFREVYKILTGETNTDFYKALLNATEITIEGSASKQGVDSDNITLSNNRIKIVKDWFKTINQDEKIYKTKSIYNQTGVNTDENTNSKDAKLDRFARVVIVTKGESVESDDINNTLTDVVTLADPITNNTLRDNGLRIKKSFYNYYNDNKGINLRNDEAQFFEKIGSNKDKEIIFKTLSEKIKYFSPAFHSMTPEGFNTRLTFLHQCTRQGPTSEATNSNTNRKSATNMAFGRPPICILRVGDFYNTKIVIDSMNIDFDPLVWDLNPEGIGVQPMIASVTINFKFIGGSDLTGPIARLQNAVTFNFFANTGVYDDRNDRIIPVDINDKTKGTKYADLYNPYVYDNNTKSAPTV